MEGNLLKKPPNLSGDQHDGVEDDDASERQGRQLQRLKRPPAKPERRMSSAHFREPAAVYHVVKHDLIRKSS